MKEEPAHFKHAFDAARQGACQSILIGKEGSQICQGSNANR